MIVRKLRLQHAWSQDQLAQLSGLSVRTIQRIERGQKADLETLKSLAAVFNVSVEQLQPEATMSSDLNQSAPLSSSGPAANQVSPEEQLAMEAVRGLRKFYMHLISYLCVISMLGLINYLTSSYPWVIWPALGWGVGLLSQAINVLGLGRWLGPEWEKREVEKRLGRKL